MPLSVTDADINAEYAEKIRNIPKKKKKRRSKNAKAVQDTQFAQYNDSKERRINYFATSYM